MGVDVIFQVELSHTNSDPYGDLHASVDSLKVWANAQMDALAHWSHQASLCRSKGKGVKI